MPYDDALDPDAPATLANTMPTGGTWDGPLSQAPLGERLRRTSMPTLDTGVSSRTMFLRGIAQRNAKAAEDHQNLVNQTTAFNAWYGGLSPEEKAKFTPADTTSSLIGNTDKGLTIDVGHNAEGLTRQAAWEHFKKQPAPQAGGIPIGSPSGPTPSGEPLPGGATLGGPAARPVLPLSLAPQPQVTRRVVTDPRGRVTTTETTAPGKAVAPPKAPATRTPSQIAADEALAAQRSAAAAKIEQDTRNAVAATQPGGKDYKDPKPPPRDPNAPDSIESRRLEEEKFNHDQAAALKLHDAWAKRKRDAYVAGIEFNEQEPVLPKRTEVPTTQPNAGTWQTPSGPSGTPDDNGPTANPATSGARPVVEPPTTQPNAGIWQTPAGPTAPAPAPAAAPPIVFTSPRGVGYVQVGTHQDGSKWGQNAQTGQWEQIQ